MKKLDQVLADSYSYELGSRILLNILSVGLSFFFLFLNKEIITLTFLKNIFKNSPAMEQLNLFPYFEYTTFNDIYMFYFIICYSICFSVHFPFIVWQVCVHLNNSNYWNLLTKTWGIYYSAIYVFLSLSSYAFFIWIYCWTMSTFQLLFNTNGSTNALGLIIDYIPTITHLSSCYILYIKITFLVCLSFSSFIFYAHRANFYKKISMSYKTFPKLECYIKCAILSFSSLGILCFVPPFLTLHVMLIFQTIWFCEILCLSLKLLLRFEIFFL